MGNNNVSDISQLKHLTKLTFLDLDTNQISDISPLEDLACLTRLWLINNKISDISPLKRLTKLEWLSLQNNKISDITALKDLQKLKRVLLKGNQISDFSHISHVKYVHGLNDQGPSGLYSQFYIKLMDNKNRDINRKITELIESIEDVHQMKFFYTLVSNAYRMNEIKEEDRVKHIKKGLEVAALKAVDEDAFIIFKRILDKA